ncbi:MAG TPA: ABC transporter permease [Pseudonocardiaceae bacterium]|jgi:ABC-2 type transport system permease protein|nr:ABC transporter permease [Pseudonocardiaceae bacterium]
MSMLLRQTGLVFLRSIRPTLHRPSVIIIGLAQPLLYLVLFGPLLRGLSTGDGDSWQWYVPGIMVQLALFGTAYSGFGLLPELRSGALERLRVSPVSRIALLLGRVSRDVTLLVVQAALLALVSVPFGFRAGVGPVLLGLALLALLGLAIGSASYALAMRLRQEYAFAPVLAMTVLPAMLLSGVLLPMNLAPRWLYVLSRVNPLSHVVDAERAIVAGQWGATSIWLGPLLAVALAAVCVTWGAWTFRQDSV